MLFPLGLLGFWVICSLLPGLRHNAVQAIDLDITSQSSIKAAAKLIAADLMTIYTGNQPGATPGILPDANTASGYYWWIGGGMFGTMVNYWYYTGDDTWVNETAEAIIWQAAASEGCCFNPHNQTLDMGNDDQAFWAFAALMAAEYNFPQPPSGPDWLTMVQAVFNVQYYRWDPNCCGGGLHWQANSAAAGTSFDYKNSISNGAFFNIAARLAKFTGNQSYADAATQWYEWSQDAGLIDNTTYNIIDGIVPPADYVFGGYAYNSATYNTEPCPSSGHTEQWTYNNGVYLYGAAVMWNFTQEDVWQQRTISLLNSAIGLFFTASDTASNGKVLTEVICEPVQPQPEGTCQIDQSTFKGYLARFMTASALVAPFIAANVSAALQPSAQAAARLCVGPGGLTGAFCGFQWYLDTYYDDPLTGVVGPDMNALEVIQTLLPVSGPLTQSTGATSKGNASAGTDNQQSSDVGVIQVTLADKVGAAVMTVALGSLTIGVGAWMMMA